LTQLPEVHTKLLELGLRQFEAQSLNLLVEAMKQLGLCRWHDLLPNAELLEDAGEDADIDLLSQDLP
jgi:hypothetical protein